MNEKPPSTSDSEPTPSVNVTIKPTSWEESTGSSASSTSSFSPHIVLGIAVASLSAGVAALLADPQLVDAVLSGHALDRGIIGYGALVLLAGALSALHYYLPGPPKK